MDENCSVNKKKYITEIWIDNIALCVYDHYVHRGDMNCKAVVTGFIFYY